MSDSSAVRIVFNHLPEIARKLEAKAGEVVKKTASNIEADVKLSMNEAKSGRTYLRASGTHTASAPGEAPAVDYGFLINSIQTDMPEPTYAEVSAEASYAVSLEFGGARVAPRPYMRPAAEKNREAFIKEMTGLEDKLR